MSLRREEQLKCTKCGSENTFALYESVNVTLEPELKKRVLDGSLFKMTCASCKAEVIVNYDVLYHDMWEFRPVMIQCYQTGDHWEKVNHQNENIRKMMDDMKLSADFPHRVVIGYSALREAVRIFDAGYDDRILFIVKKLFGTLLKRDGVACRGILFCGRDEKNMPVFSVLNTKNEENFYNLPADMYDHISEKITPMLPKESEEFILVDDAYVTPFLERL